MISVIDFIFYLINFFALIFLCSYVFNKYFAKSIKHKIEQESNLLDNLNEDITNSINLQKRIEKDIIDQDILGKELNLKVILWDKTVQQEIAAKKLTFDQHQTKYEKLLETASKNYNLKKDQKNLSPIIVDKLTKIATDYYSDPKNSKKYLDSIIINLPKS